MNKTRLLGDYPFLFGSEATTVDCALFACISCVMAGDPADDSAFRRGRQEGAQWRIEQPASTLGQDERNVLDRLG